MEIAIALIALLVGILIGFLIASDRLHKKANGTLMFDRSAPNNAPYLCFESYDELAEIRTKKYATLNVSWSNGDSRA